MACEYENKIKDLCSNLSCMFEKLQICSNLVKTDDIPNDWFDELIVFFELTREKFNLKQKKWRTRHTDVDKIKGINIDMVKFWSIFEEKDLLTSNNVDIFNKIKMKKDTSQSFIDMLVISSMETNNIKEMWSDKTQAIVLKKLLSKRFDKNENIQRYLDDYFKSLETLDTNLNDSLERTLVEAIENEKEIWADSKDDEFNIEYLGVKKSTTRENLTPQSLDVIKDKNSKPMEEKEKIKKKRTRVSFQEEEAKENYEPEDDRYRQFPFINTKPPSHLFCNYMNKEAIQCCLLSECTGDMAKLVNNLPSSLAKWEYCDQNYFIPFFDKIRGSFGDISPSESKNPVIKRINDLETNLLNNIGAFFDNSSSDIGVLTQIQSGVDNIKNQLVSMGKIHHPELRSTPMSFPVKQSTIQSPSGKDEPGKKKKKLIRWDGDTPVYEYV